MAKNINQNSSTEQHKVRYSRREQKKQQKLESDLNQTFISLTIDVPTTTQQQQVTTSIGKVPRVKRVKNLERIIKIRKSRSSNSDDIVEQVDASQPEQQEKRVKNDKVRRCRRHSSIEEVSVPQPSTSSPPIDIKGSTLEPSPLVSDQKEKKPRRERVKREKNVDKIRKPRYHRRDVDQPTSTSIEEVIVLQPTTSSPPPMIDIKGSTVEPSLVSDQKEKKPRRERVKREKIVDKIRKPRCRRHTTIEEVSVSQPSTLSSPMVESTVEPSPLVSYQKEKKPRETMRVVLFDDEEEQQIDVSQTLNRDIVKNMGRKSRLNSVQDTTTADQVESDKKLKQYSRYFHKTNKNNMVACVATQPLSYEEWLIQGNPPKKSTSRHSHGHVPRVSSRGRRSHRSH